MALTDPFSFMFRQKRINESEKQNGFKSQRPNVQNNCNNTEEERGSIDFKDINSVIQNIGSFSTKIVPFIQQYGPIVKNLPAMWEFINETSTTQEETPDGYRQTVELESAKFKSAAFYNGGTVEPVPPPPETNSPSFGRPPEETTDEEFLYVKQANKNKPKTKKSTPKIFFKS